jgi:hypothetical protein
MTTEPKNKLTCEVKPINPPSGVSPNPTVFDLSGPTPRFVSGPGYVDGMLAHIEAALSHARWQREQFGHWDRVAMGGYYYTFRD